MNPIQRPHDIRIPTLEQIFAQLVRVGHFMRSTHQAPDTMEDTPEVQSEIPADDHVHTLIQPDAESLCLHRKNCLLPMTPTRCFPQSSTSYCAQCLIEV
jgi:hypothetical protein